MTRSISVDDKILRAPALHNAYPIANEVSARGVSPTLSALPVRGECKILDDYYGRIYDEGLIRSLNVYGRSDGLDYYQRITGLQIVDELRVPFRKIPIYSVNRVGDIDPYLDVLSQRNQSHRILLRGQVHTYLIGRPKEDYEMLYGEVVDEPSFLPSHLRANFDEYTLKSIWHSMSAILLQEARIDASAGKGNDIEYRTLDAQRVRNTVLFDLFALGVAQHYGLPSVGLDLTNNAAVAAWFALNKISIDPSGGATSSPIDRNDKPTIFVFRCPLDAVYDYEVVRPKILEGGRPVQQHAWFGHVGWGEAKNQLGSYLVCGFRLSEDCLNDQPIDQWRSLFPSSENDYVLSFFKKMRARNCYVGEAKRALDRLYDFHV